MKLEICPYLIADWNKKEAMDRTPLVKCKRKGFIRRCIGLKECKFFIELQKKK